VYFVVALRDKKLSVSLCVFIATLHAQDIAVSGLLSKLGRQQHQTKRHPVFKL
jgi:hypothetical protein